MNHKPATNKSKGQNPVKTGESRSVQESPPKESIRFPLFPHRHEQPVHWKNAKELHRIMHDFPGKLQSGSLTAEELKERFTADFCEHTPKILILSGMGYRPESGEDLYRYLELFVKQKKLINDEGRYWHAGNS